MKWLGYIILGAIALLLAIAVWPLTLSILVIWLVIHWILRAREEKERQRAEQAKYEAGVQRALEQEQERIQRHKDEQDEVSRQIVALGEQSLVLFESLPNNVISAERFLDQAQADFAEGVFAPFWDDIEKSAKRLGRFDEAVRGIGENWSRYNETIKQYEGTPPAFPIERGSVEKLQVAEGTAQRMKALVRNAQRDFQFATIYEQRKTNQILVAGFKSLAQALDQMTSKIQESIADVSEALCESTEEAMKASSEATGRQEKALKMLDNIQRRRRPAELTSEDAV